MGLFDFILGDTDSEIERLRRDSDAAVGRSRELVESSMAVGRAERRATSNLLMREIENARLVSNQRDPMASRSATAGVRARLGGERRATLGAAGATGAAAAVNSVTSRGIAEAVDAERSLRIRRASEATRASASIATQLGQITQAGFSAELGAANAQAGREVNTTLQVNQAAIEASSRRSRAMLGLVGGLLATTGVDFGAAGALLGDAGGALGKGLDYLVPDSVEDFFADMTYKLSGGGM